MHHANKMEHGATRMFTLEGGPFLSGPRRFLLQGQFDDTSKLVCFEKKIPNSCYLIVCNQLFDVVTNSLIVYMLLCAIASSIAITAHTMDFNLD